MLHLVKFLTRNSLLPSKWHEVRTSGLMTLGQIKARTRLLAFQLLYLICSKINWAVYDIVSRTQLQLDCSVKLILKFNEQSFRKEKVNFDHLPFNIFILFVYFSKNLNKRIKCQIINQILRHTKKEKSILDNNAMTQIFFTGCERWDANI